MATAIDNLGRKIDSSNMSLGEIKALIGTMMKSKVGAPRPIDAKKEGNGDQSEGLGKVRELLEQYTKDFAREMQEQKGFLSDVVDNLRELVQKRIEKKAESKGQPKKEKKDKKDKPFISKEEKLMSKSSDGLYKTFSKKGSGYTHDIYVEKAIRELCSCLKGISPPSTPTPAPDDGESAGGKTGGSSNGAGGRSNSGADPTRMIDGLAVSKDLTIMSNFMSEISNEMYAIEKHLLGFNVLGEIFNGVIDKERKIVQEMRSISYEIAGATKESMGLMRSFEDIGSTTKQTGVDRDVFQKSYVKALKHGIKDLKVASNLVKTQLNTEKQLGMEAGSLGEEFVSWNKAGRMSIGQLADMGRGMREIARNTGMTGDELAGVIKGSKEFIDTLRNAATLTATAAKNVIEIGANAKKLGIESQMQPLMKAMTSSSNLFLEATDANRALLLMAASSVGRMSELTTGTITKTKAGIQAMGKGFENVLKRFGVESFEAIDQLSEPIKAQINVAMKSTIGMELGELRAAKETLDEAGKGMADRLSDINKKRQQNLTLEERASLMEEERRMKTSKNLEVLTALDEAAKGAKDMNQALATFGKRRGDFESDLNALGQSWTSEADVARGAIQNAMNSVNDGLKEAGKQELTIDSSAIERALKDPAAMRELTSQISKGEQELATAQKSQLDPLTDMQHSLSEINDNIRNYTNKSFSMFFNSLIGKILVIGAAITAAITGIGLLAMGIIVKLDSFKRVLSTIDKRQGLFKVLKGTFGQEKVEDKHGNRPGEEGYVETFEKSLYGLIKGTLGFGHPKKDGPEAGLPKGDEPLVRAKTKDPIAEALNSIKIDDEDIFPKMYDELKAIRKCVCMDKSKLISDKSAVEAKAASSPDKSKWAADKAAGQAKAASMSPTEKTQARIDRKLQDKDALMQKKDVKMQKNDIKSQKVGDKVQDAQQSLVVRQTKMASAESGSIPTTPKTEGFDLAGMLASGKEMAKAAVAVAILGLGIIALGAAIVFLSSKIMSAFKLDIKTVLETAAVVGAVALAGGAIAAAGFVALEALSSDKMKSFTEKAKTSYPKVLTAAAALMLIGPAIVLLGAAVVAMTGLILSKLGLNIGSVAETAAVIVAVAGVTGAMAAGAKEFVECLEGLQEGSTWKKIIDNPGAIAKEIGKAAAALLLVGGVIMLLGVALVKMGQVVMSVAGLDPSTAVKVATQVAGLIVAAGAIAGAIIGASFGLKALGEFAKKSTGLVKDMAVGAVALLIMTPAIVLLASAVIWASTSIMGAFGMDSGVAAKAAMNIGELILATGFIALAIMGASAGLALLGAFALSFSGPQALALAGLMAAGAGALLLLTPAITALAAGVVYMAQKVMGSFGLDLGTAAKVAKDLAGVLMAAGFIALAVMGTGWALGQLGALVASGLIWPTVLMAGLGAIGLMALTPAITALAASVVYMAKSVMKNIIDPAEAGKVAEALGDVIGAAAAISISVLGMGAALAALGLAMTTGVFLVMAPLALLGAAGLLVLTPAVVALNAAIISMSQSITGVSPAHGKEIAEALSSILSSAGNIANEVLGAVGSLSKLGALSLFAGIISKLMWMGVGALDTLAGPVKGYIGAVVDIAQSMKSSLNPKQAVEMAKGVAEILASCGAVTEEIMKAKDKLLSMPAATKWFQFMRTTLQKDLFAGQSFLRYISLPIQAYVNAIVEFSRAIGGSLNPKQAAEMGKGVAEILAACGAVTEEMMKAKDKLLSMKGSVGFWKSVPIEDAMSVGVEALKKMKQPIMDYVGTIVGFAQDIGGKVNVGSAKSMVKSLTAVSTIVELVSNVLNTLSEKIVPLTQGGWFTGSPIKQMTKAKGQMEVFFPAMVDLIRTIIDKVSGSLGDTKELKSAAKGLQAMAMILNAALPSITIMGEKIAPLTQGGFFTDSPIDKIKSAIPQFDGFFNAVGEFVNKIVVAMATIKDTTGLSDAAKKMTMLATVLESTSKAIGSLASMVGLMDDGLFTKSPITKIIENKTKFADYFTQIAEFVNIGIVEPINNKFPDGKSLQTASVIVLDLARLLCGTKVTLESLASVIGLMEPKTFFDKAPLQKIIDNKDQFKSWFIAIAEFVKEGIVIPVNDKFKDPKQILTAANTISNMAVVAKNIVPMIKNLAEAISLGTDSSSFFDVAPIPKIIENKGQFKIWFQSIAEFMRDGIVNPVNKEMKGIDIGSASQTITAMAKIAGSIVPMITNLSGAMGLVSDPAEKFWDRDFPIDKIMVYKNDFAKWFKSIAIFMRDGIIIPILTVLPEPQTIQMAAQILSAMSQVITLVPAVINKMANGLIPLIDSGVSIDETAKQKLEGKTDTFRNWFTSVAQFMVDGIILPILTVLPEPQTIQMAAQILSAMSRVITMLPTIISNLSAMFIPLDAGKCLKDSPISALAANADIFAAWFNSITLFVRDGILRPIMTNLPTADEITAGMSQLGNMSKGIAAAEQMVTYVSERMNQLSINPFWTMVASWKASIFSNAFTELANTINNGIFQPMKLLPTSDEMIEAISQMKFMAKTFDIANKVFTYVSGRMSEFSINPFWTIMASWKASMFGYAFMGVANAINNGILQPMKLLPPSSEIDEVVNQLDGMVMALNKVEEVLGAMDIAMKSISNSGIDFSALDKIPVQKMAMFATALKDMTAATSMGSGGSAGTGGGAGTPSEKAIETQLLRDQSITQQSMSTALTQMVNEAMTGDGLFVRDRLNFKAQNDMIKIQRDEAKSALMPSAAQTASASKSGGFELTEESKKKIKEAQAKPAAAGNLFHRLDMRKIQRDKAKSALMPSAAQTASASASKSGGFELTEESKKKIKEAQAKNDPLKPAIKSINPSSAIGNLDMRSAAESMKDTPMQRALGDNIRERANKNPYTDRLKESQEATRIRREQAGFQTGGEAMSPPRAEFGNFFKNEEKIRGSSEPGRLISSNPGGNESGNATMQPVARATGISDMHSAVAQDKASSSPSKTEITSPELGTIASEAGDHNAKLDTLITLFQQVLTALKPSSTPITSSGGSPGDTKTRDVVHKPANFFRNTVGLVTQTAGKAALNMGAPNA